MFVKTRFVKARNLGRKVSCARFYSNSNEINANLNPNVPRVPKSAAMRLFQKYNIKLRRV